MNICKFFISSRLLSINYSKNAMENDWSYICHSDQCSVDEKFNESLIQVHHSYTYMYIGRKHKKKEDLK